MSDDVNKKDAVDFQGSDTVICVTTVDGKNVTAPLELPWGRELKAFKALGGLIRALPALQEIKWDEAIDNPSKVHIDIKSIIAFMPELLADGSEFLGQIAAAALGKDTNWVEDNLNVEGVLAVVIPFFKAYAGKIAGLINAGASHQ